jgi:regulatory protein
VAILTGLAPDPHQPGYRLLEVDRGRFASLPAADLADLPLEVDREIPGPLLARLQALADVEGAYRAAVRSEARRAHARRDLRRRLIQKQHPPAAVEAALDRLAAQGLLDDDRFALAYAAARLRRGRGPARILRDLQAQGVERRMAEAAVAQATVEEGVEPEREARRIAERRAAQLVDFPVPTRRRRLRAFLLRRGFGGGEIRTLIEELCG